MTKQIAVRIPEELDDRLETLAQKTGRTKTFYVRLAIESQLDTIEQEYMTDDIITRLKLDTVNSRWLNPGDDFAEECRRQSEALRGDPEEEKVLRELQEVADTREWR